jgi:outer membrane protein OmpA-like peptidoglycan-associated protein
MNTPFSEFGVVYFADGLVFASNRIGKETDPKKPVTTWNKQSFYDLYIGTINKNEDVENIKPFAKELNTALHEGPAAFGEVDSIIYFNRSNNSTGQLKRDPYHTNHFSLLVAIKENEIWKVEKKISFDNDSLSICHPSLSTEGDKLFFASKMPGGYGGMDIYMTSRTNNGQWSRPVNLGPNVNTAFNEIFPYIHENGLLFYASDKPAGMGGLDIYYTFQNKQEWEEGVNLGEPFNSNKDDYNLILDPVEYKGYFTSNRQGGKGDEDIYFYEIRNSAPVVNSDSATAYSYQTKVEIDCMANDYDPDKDKLSMDGFSEVSKNGATIEFDSLTMRFVYYIPENFVGTDSFSYTLCDDFGVNQLCNSANVIVSIKKGEFSLKGRVLIREVNGKTMTPVSGVQMALRDKGEFTIGDTLTDKSGNFNFSLLPETDYKLRLKKQGYLVKYVEFSTKGMSPGNIERDEYIEKLEVGKTFILENLYYDLDKWDIRPDAALVLNELTKLMKENPTLKIELGSHTDSRGSDSYNMTLSQKRATSAVDYIIKNGIKSDRIIAKGYGETKLVNKCSNDVNCSEEEHQKNRRTEVKIISF